MHLLVETVEPNLSGALQWINVSYVRGAVGSKATFLPLGHPSFCFLTLTVFVFGLFLSLLTIFLWEDSGPDIFREEIISCFRTNVSLF